MIVIRLTRFGRIKFPFYRIIVTEKRTKREVKPLEVVGTWNPFTKEIKIDNDKVKAWIAKGAKISSGVTKLLKPNA